MDRGPVSPNYYNNPEFILISEDGLAYLVKSDDNTLKTLQTLVDGLVECVTANKQVIGFDADVWVNEEGLFRNDFGINLVASYITGRQIVGPAVLARSNKNGKTIGLTGSQINRLIEDGLLLETADEGSGNAFRLCDLIDFLRAEEEVA